MDIKILESCTSSVASDDRSGKPEKPSQPGYAAEFVNKVKDQVRNRQIRMSSVAESGEEHSIIW